MIKNIFKILLIICALSTSLKAQIYFNKNYEINSQISNASAVIELNTGEYLFPSNVYYIGKGLLIIMKIAPNGDTIFTKQYTNPSLIYSTGFSNSLIKTLDNNYVFSGSVLDTNNNRDALLVKMTINGDTIWTKTYGGANFDNTYCVVQTLDSGFVMMGATESFSTGPASDFYMIKSDKNGNMMWQKNYGTTLVEACVSGQITLDRGFIMAGYRSNALHIVKTDSAGSFQWEKTYAGTNNAGFIKQFHDSTYVLSGSKLVSGMGHQAYLAKLDKAGNVIWEKTYGGIGDQRFFTNPVILNDGSIVCAGSSVNGIVPWGLLVKTDSQGNQQWLREYYANPNKDNYFYDLKYTTDNGFIMSGFAVVASSDPWLVKVDSNGCPIANCNVGVYENEEMFSALKVYPNPSAEQFNVEVLLPLQNNKAELIIYDLLGKEINRYYIKNNETLNINTSEYNNGIYLITLSTSTGVVENKRLIINK